MGNQHKQICSFAIREIQIKTARCHFVSTRMAIIKHIDRDSVGEDKEKLETSFIASR